MSFTLRVYFEGLYLVAIDSTVSLLLVDGRAPGAASVDGLNHVSHVAAMRFAAAAVVGDARALHRSYEPLVEPETAACYFAGDLLTVDADLVNHQVGGTGVTFDPSFDLVPKLNRLYERDGGFALSPASLGSTDLAAAGVVARMPLHSGVISAVPKYVTMERYTFVDLDRPDVALTAPQRLPARMCYTTVVRSDAVTFRRYRDGAELAPITLKPNQARGGDRVVDVFLENAPPRGLREAREAVAPSFDKDIDLDFELIYGVCDPRPARRLVPKLNREGSHSFQFPCVGGCTIC